MTRFSRWNWLLAPVGFGISYRLTLWLIHIPDRNAWIAMHGGNPASVAWGEGEMDGMAALLTFDLLIVSAICCAFGPRVRPRETFAIGVSTALVSLAIDRFLWNFFENEFGRLATFHGIPILVAGLLVLALGYTRYRRLNVADYPQ